MQPDRFKEVILAGKFSGKDVRLVQPVRFKLVISAGKFSGKDVRLVQSVRFKLVISLFNSGSLLMPSAPSTNSDSVIFFCIKIYFLKLKMVQ